VDDPRGNHIEDFVLHAHIAVVVHGLTRVAASAITTIDQYDFPDRCVAQGVRQALGV
jgi:hypothetical protein